MPARHTFNTLIFLVIIALATASVPFEAISGDAIQPETAACCSECDKTTAPTPAPADDGCCSDGCHHCFLPCCSGLVAFGSPSTITGPNLISICSAAPYDNSFAAGYPGEIYRPPYV